MANQKLLPRTTLLLSAFLLLVTLVTNTSMNLSHYVFAQNMTETTAPSSEEGVPFVIQETKESMPDIFMPGHQQYHQVAVALPDRLHDKVYTGTVTYTATQPLQLVIGQPFNASTIQNATGFPLGAQVGGVSESVSLLHNEEGAFFGSENFAGSGLYFHGRSNQPFVVSYTIVGKLVDPTPISQ